MAAHSHSHASLPPPPPQRKHAHARTPSAAIPALITTAPIPTHSASHYDTSHSHTHTLHRRTNSGPLPLSSLFSLHLLPTHLRPQLLFALAHLTLGASLWVSGQARDSLAVTGLGYLVVFDALGVLNPVAASWMSGLEGARRRRKAEERGRSGLGGGKEGDVRRPFGAHRTSTLLHFTQSIYLLFSALYVCKESVEHALLHPSGSIPVHDDHSTATVGSAHPSLIHTGDHEATIKAAVGIAGEHVHEESMRGIELPIWLLIAATLACMYANLRLGNHARLMAACGMSTTTSSATSSSAATSSHNRHRSVLFDPALQATRGASALLTTLLSNPFSLTVLFFSGSLTFASLTMPGIQVAALDKVLAGLESVSMGWLAWPASLALGKVLLQTAPAEAENNEQRKKVERVVKEIEAHPLVSYVSPLQLWQLTPPTTSQILLETSASRHMHSASVAVSPLGGGRGGHGGRSRGAGENGGGGGNFGMVQMQARTAPLILTVEILLDRTKAKAGDCLEITRWAYDLLAPCVGAAWGVEVGMVGRGGVRAGEVVVKVRREGKEADEIEEEERALAHGHGCGGHDHDHGHGHDHGHAHDHGHGHSHAHGHAHEHGHGHSHAHEHSHGHGHAHEHSHGHGHAHEHSHGHDHGHSHDHSHGGHSQEPSHDHDHSHVHGHAHSHSPATEVHLHGHFHAHEDGHGHGHGHSEAHTHSHTHA